MKTYTMAIFSFCLILVTTTTGMKCKKETGIDALPPITQEGRETFGCLVNGIAFTPKGSNLGGPTLSSYYQYVQSPTLEGLFFNVSAKKKNGDSNGTEIISIGTLQLPIEQGGKYKLGIKYSGNATAQYGIIISINSDYFNTNGVATGELNISRFDEVNQIVAGTFWFDAVNDKGEKVEVREGRFDVHFVK